MSERTRRDAECCERPAPQKTSRSTVTKTEGTDNYGTKTPSVKEEKSDASAERAR
jgi:hypothetical protein